MEGAYKIVKPSEKEAGMGQVGITAYGGYLPRLRLSRESIVRANSWANPTLMAYSKSERATCDVDEDSVTMAVEAALLYMCSEHCEDTGYYINAFAGYYSRSNIVTGPGTYLPDVPSPEEIMEKWADITSLDDAKFYPDISGMMTIAMSATNRKE